MRRLNEEHKFNQLHSEPSSDKGGDSETRALIGDIFDSKKLLNHSSKKKIMVD